ncbi:MAG: hypothetical protein FWE05_13715 [Defluviitaleaceae bacterium]|nr:hypothetical protein [Defluviitaleaceae bacterium]
MITTESMIITEEITQVLFMSFGAAFLSGFTVFFISWGIVSALNVYKKLL